MGGFIPNDFIQELLNRTDIVEVIDTYTNLPLNKAGQNYTARCPFHDDKSPSLSINTRQQYFNCFGCGQSGNAINFVMQHEKLDFVAAIESLAEKAGLEVPYEGRSANHAIKKSQQQDLTGLLEKACQFFQTQLKKSDKAKTYLQQRGLTGKICQQYQVGYAPAGWENLISHFQAKSDDALLQQLATVGLLIKKEKGGYYDRFRDRIMFPIKNRHGKLIGFGGRVISDDDTPKYLNSPETPLFHKGQELYGLYEAKQSQSANLSYALIVEGYIDVLALAQHQLPQCVATLGTATTHQHLEQLFRQTSKIIFCFDGDAAGKRAAWKALQITFPIMVDGRQARFLFLDDGEDPDNVIRQHGTEKFQARIDNACQISQFFFNHLRLEADLQSMDGRAQFAKQANHLIKQIPTGVFQHLMYEELSKLTRIDQKALGRPQSTETARPINNKQRHARHHRLNPTQLAISLLLHEPQLARCVSNPLSLSYADDAETTLLIKLLEIIAGQPQINTAGLLEKWRNSPDESILNNLLGFELLFPEQGTEAEFVGAIQRIREQTCQQQINQLLVKGSQHGLNEMEKSHLQNLINQLKNAEKAAN